MNARRFLGALSLGIVLSLLGACGSTMQSTNAWIDVPLNGLTFPMGVEINIEGHAANPTGITRVEIWVNGSLITTLNNLTAENGLIYFSFAWTPPQPGQYTIQAQAFGADSTSATDTTVINVGGNNETPTLVDTITPVTDIAATPVDTVTPPSSGAVIQFWADPAEIDASACTNIRWHVENVSRVVFGGIDQPFDGSYKDCLCANQRYTLTVTHLDGSEEKRTVDIQVNGSCDTPTSPVETTAPPIPTPVVPDNGLTLSCRSSANLAWLPVTDPSGIAKYEVEVQRHGGDNNWQGAGSVTVSDKSTSISVECGWYYRWRVRAVDGVGNVSGWSGWWQFTITLT